jgi:hypothetical protein
MAEERRKATSLDSEEGKEMSCPKCGFDEVAHQERKDRKIERLQGWLDSEPDEYCIKNPQFRETVNHLLTMYILTDEVGRDDNVWQSIRSILKMHPHSPVR